MCNVRLAGSNATRQSTLILLHAVQCSLYSETFIAKSFICCFGFAAFLQSLFSHTHMVTAAFCYGALRNKEHYRVRCKQPPFFYIFTKDRVPTQRHPPPAKPTKFIAFE